MEYDVDDGIEWRSGVFRGVRVWREEWYEEGDDGGRAREAEGKIGERHGRPVRRGPHFLGAGCYSSLPSVASRSHEGRYAQGQGHPCPPTTHPRIRGGGAVLVHILMRGNEVREQRIRSRIMQLSVDSLRGIAQRKLALSRARRLMITVVRSTDRAAARGLVY